MNIQKVTLYVFLFCSGIALQADAGQTRDKADPILEWQFALECTPGNSNSEPIKAYFTEVSGLVNQNEWECERLTSQTGRETSSCVPSQFVVKPLILRRGLTLNDVSEIFRILFFPPPHLLVDSLGFMEMEGLCCQRGTQLRKN